MRRFDLSRAELTRPNTKMTMAERHPFGILRLVYCASIGPDLILFRSNHNHHAECKSTPCYNLPRLEPLLEIGRKR